MIAFLYNVLYKRHTKNLSSDTRQIYGLLCGSVGIFLNLILFIGKFMAGLLSGSIAIMADAFNNLSDAGSSLITLIGFKMSSKKPDLDHPFGHGRIEYISGLMVAFAIILMAFELIKSSIKKILHPSNIDTSILIICILIFSIIIKLYMYYYNHSIALKISSSALTATAIDSFSDSVATSVVLITTLISRFSGLLLDGYCGVLVGVFILFSGYKALKETLSPLLGQPPAPELVSEIERIVMEAPDITGMHDLVVHNYGPGRVMITLHAEVPSDKDILMIHDTIDNIETTLKNKLHCEATIHMDPIMTNDPYTIELRAKVEKILKNYPKIISFHDFRIVKGPTHTNIVFDVLLHMNEVTPENELLNQITFDIQHNIGPQYCVVIQFDRSYEQ